MMKSGIGKQLWCGRQNIRFPIYAGTRVPVKRKRDHCERPFMLLHHRHLREIKRYRPN